MPEHLALAHAGEPDLGSTSESEEMYLITVARAVESGRSEPVPMALIAETLSVSVASANEMVRKLASRDLMTYEPYHGAGLTSYGWEVANRVLRARRLWATFLAGQLGFSPIDADEQACHLEHVASPEAMDRMAAFLGNPSTDPLGWPIPDPATVSTARTDLTPLDQVAVGSVAEVVALRTTGAAREFITGEGLTLGVTVRLLANGATGVLIDADGRQLSLTHELAATIDVRSDARSAVRSTRSTD